MKIVPLALICICLTAPAFGQITARNPVDELKDQVTQGLTDAKVPLTPEQEKQLTLLIEEERQAAEIFMAEHGDRWQSEWLRVRGLSDWADYYEGLDHTFRRVA